MAPIRVLVVGAGHMGRSHAFAYSKLPGFEVVGIVTRTPESRLALVKELGSNIPDFGNFDDALAQTHPDAVCVCSYPDSHYKYAIAALDANCDVFVEKPLAATVAEAEEIVSKANQMNKKVVVGYILRQHPTWQRFIEVSHDLGKPLVMRMNLNQQSSGATWKTHKALMETCSPIVDCGVHYIDVMVQMTRSKPIRVSGICARLSDEIKPDMFNYGHLQVVFEDGSVGFYEAGWGPSMSQEAFFIKDVIGPKGSATIVAGEVIKQGKSDDVDSHTAAQCLRLHHAALGKDGKFAKQDEILATGIDPGHDGLCEREQLYFEKAIRENLDLSEHLEAAINSMKVVDAADRSFREGRMIEL